MSQQEVTGSLSSGNRYRATSYMVEVSNPAGEVVRTVDINDVVSVTRGGNTVTILQQDGRELGLTCVTLDDAGRLETTFRPKETPEPQAVSVTVRQPEGPPGIIQRARLAIGAIGLLGLVYLFVAATQDGDLPAGATADDYIAAYAPHLQNAILLVGAIVALYVITRVVE